MKKMLMFEKMCEMQQNLASVESKEGIFILDRHGNILFANEKAKEVWMLRNELGKILSKNSSCLRLGSKEINIYPIFENGKTSFFFGIVRETSSDIELKRYVDRAYEKMKIFKERIAHHFFNPLVIAKGYLNLLLEKNLDADDKAQLEKIKTAVERVEAVVKNIVINGEICE
ncbi:MAG: hypothetical protein FE047_01880 [Thermoplasmata archaeon]|nr:MAG: hypothetical protein FE047_01880 [Thermoplasmata archaeon]KAA0009307.1 MAG: hypothetical protein FE041_06220 [Thermoplasmata archaeon]